MNRNLVLLFVVAFTAIQSWAASIQGVSGSLVYSGGTDGNYSSLVYKTESGNILQVFDEGLRFNYDSRYDVSNLSPDKAYSVVHFSESGVLSGDAGTQDEVRTMYLCAFVRMSDGCVVSVEVGVQCDGEWSGTKQWRSSISSTNDYLLNNAPTVDKTYKDYASGRKDLIQVSSPRILAYFAEGTAFDNLLACDPPRKANKKTYADLRTLLQRDGDANNVAKLKAVMNGADQLSGEGVSSPSQNMSGWIVRSVLSEKAYLYTSPAPSGVTSAYLVRGDVVSVSPSPVHPFVKFRYQQKLGKVIEKWIRCEDVDFCDSVDRAGN